MAPDIPIDDAADPRIADYRNLSDAELLRSRGAFIAEGRLVVRRLLTESSYRVRSVLVTPAARTSLDDVLAASTVPAFVCPLRLLEQITGFNIHRGCLAVGERPAFVDPGTFVAGAGPILVLEGVGNPDNVGLIFRNAAAFGAAAVVLDPGCCDPLYRKAIRTSMGAALTIPFASNIILAAFVERLSASGWTVLALTPDASATDIDSVRSERHPRIALVFGSEGFGLSAPALAKADRRVRIPIQRGADSLNVAVAAGIALHALARRRE